MATFRSLIVSFSFFWCVNAHADAPRGELVLTLDTLNADALGHSNAVVRVVNQGTRSYEAVVVGCAFLENGKATSTSEAVITNLAAGETAFATVRASAPAQQARCRVNRSM